MERFLKKSKIETSICENSNETQNFISATETKAFLLKDPLLDWLRLHHKNNNNFKNNNFSVEPLVMKKGVEFEENVSKLIKEKFPFIDIGGNKTNSRNKTKFQETINAIKQGIPLIFSGVLWNFKNNTFGIPDLIIRSDYINKLTSQKSIIKEETTARAKKLKENYHYIIIDFKFTTLNLAADQTHLLNEGLIPCYKSQLYIYMKALDQIQGFKSSYAFIMGRRWKCESRKTKSDSCFDKLGKIDYLCRDSEYVDLTKNAINWLKNVKENGHKWDPFLGLSRHPYLFPNMSNKYDYPWREIKEQICEEIDEITKIWMCGVKNRNKAHDNKVFRWSDEKCTAKMLGMNGQIVGNIVDRILTTNRQDEYLIHPLKIENNSFNWREEQPQKDFFIDFEMINDFIFTDFDDLPLCKNKNLIFQIGVYFYENDKMKFKYFLSNEFNEKCEKKICNDFLNFLPKNARLFHWGNAEPSMWKKVFQSNPKKLVFIDLLKIFKDEPITIKGVFDYSLKSIAKKMYEYGMVDCLWNTETENGLGAMVNSFNAYKNNDKRLMSDVVKYNEIDCKLLYEILVYLRKNH